MEVNVNFHDENNKNETYKTKTTINQTFRVLFLFSLKNDKKKKKTYRTKITIDQISKDIICIFAFLFNFSQT